ncbi:MAG: DUF2520 domain-containing protein [Marinifilaceae bacterium]|jgi:predicted short-subunit dehydrogenase-like oxidoreductase (DUF2520 family)|nr:DUF2520 domain-containing protein [Marinifilaceae bacterium]
MTRKIVIIGAGNVATHLTRTLVKTGYNVCQIYSRTISNARELGSKTGIYFTDNIAEVYKQADIYIFSVSDTAIKGILMRLDLPKDALLIHTAGSVSMDVFKNYSTKYGVLYPLQTFTKKRIIEFSDIPICVEGNTEETTQSIEGIANNISQKVERINEDKRKYLHLSAVFACNFVNYMYSQAEQILKDNEMDFKLLHPLIEETAMKIKDICPSKAQTGPAIRNDKTTMNQHKELIGDNVDIKKLYTFISNNITKSKEENGIF